MRTRHSLCSLAVLCALLFFIGVSSFSASNAQVPSSELWQRYRVSMIYLLQEQFCAQFRNERYVPLYRFYNPGIPDHLWTTNREEYEHLARHGSGWQFEGVIGYVHHSGPEHLAIHRLYNGRQHFLTRSNQERDMLVAGGAWRFEGTIGYVAPGPVAGITQEWFRLYKHNEGHMYATEGEKNHIAQHLGWTFEGSMGLIYGTFPCDYYLRESTLHLQSTPADAAWTQRNLAALTDFVQYVPNWHALTFEPKMMSADGTLQELYKQAIFAVSNKQAAANEFVRFSNAGSFGWIEQSPTLDQFQAGMNAIGNDESYVYEINESSSRTTKSPWYDHNQQHITAGFISRLFGGRHLETSEITLHMDHFRMRFTARGIIGIPIKPGNWFNLDFIRRHESELRHHGFFGPDGRMPLVPRVIWVARNPRAEITLRESEISKLVTEFVRPDTLGVSIGGNFFRQHANTRVQIMQLGEDEFMDRFGEAMFVDDEAPEDTLSVDGPFEIEVDNPEYLAWQEEMKASSPHSDLFGGFADDGEDHDNELDEYEEDNDDLLSYASSAWLFRRRRRSPPPPPPPPPPPKIVERVATATFQSNSPYAQIIAVTSEKLPYGTVGL